MFSRLPKKQLYQPCHHKQKETLSIQNGSPVVI